MYAGYGKAIIVCEHRLHPPDVVGLLTEVEFTME